MLKYLLAGLFILVLAALLQHPIPILEGIEVHSERAISEEVTEEAPEDVLEEKNEIKSENNFHSPQANIKVPNSESSNYQLFNYKNSLVSVTPYTY